MTKYRVVYLPFQYSDLEASDVIVFAKDTKEAKKVFEKKYPLWTFKEAKEF